jgi:hypothetical protein
VSSCRTRRAALTEGEVQGKTLVDSVRRKNQIVHCLLLVDNDGEQHEEWSVRSGAGKGNVNVVSGVFAEASVPQSAQGPRKNLCHLGAIPGNVRVVCK